MHRKGGRVRRKAEFFQEITRAGDDSLLTKSWGGDREDKLFIGQPSFFAFVDMDYFGLLTPVKWIPDSYRSQGIMVPVGFVTDFASVPRIFWSFLPPIGRYGYAALFHDYVYWQQEMTREKADRVFKDTMEELGVPRWKKAVLFSAVRLFGGSAWRNNAVLKANGEKRTLKKFPDNLTMTWEAWKKDPRAFE
jgi:Protein of unknown function (DUF1353)